MGVKLRMRPCGRRWAGWHGHPEVGVWICEFLCQAHGRLLDEREACWSTGGDRTELLAPVASRAVIGRQWDTQ